MKDISVGDSEIKRINYKFKNFSVEEMNMIKTMNNIYKNKGDMHLSDEDILNIQDRSMNDKLAYRAEKYIRNYKAMVKENQIRQANYHKEKVSRGELAKILSEYVHMNGLAELLNHILVTDRILRDKNILSNELIDSTKKTIMEENEARKKKEEEESKVIGSEEAKGGIVENEFGKTQETSNKS